MLETGRPPRASGLLRIPRRRLSPSRRRRLSGGVRGSCNENLRSRPGFGLLSLACVQPCGNRALPALRLFAATFIGAVIGGAGAHAQTEQNPQQRLTPKEIKWSAASSAAGTSGAAGLQTVVLKGDPTKPGLYTLLLRLPPNTKIQAHSHKDDRTAVVVSGLWYFGYGREFNEAALKELPAGSFYTEPPGVDHFAMTKGQETVIEITGYGPSGTTYVDPKNDPGKK